MRQATPYPAHRRQTGLASNWRRRLQAVALACVTLCGSLVAQADDVQSNGLWIPNVTIQGISRGELQYMTNMGSDVSIPLAQVQGIKIPAFPDLWAAQEAIIAKNDAAALPLLQRVEGQARQPWLQQHTLWLRVHALDRLGRPIEAAEAYLALARNRKPVPDTYYLQRPPLTSLAGASAAQKQDLRKRLTQALPELEGVARSAVEAMIARLGAEQPPAGDAGKTAGGTPGDAAASPTPAPAPVAPGSPAPPGTVAPGGIVDAAHKITNTTGVAMSTYMAEPDRDEVSALLYQGKWDEALEKCKQLLAGREMRMSMRLYQQGLAQLQIAEKSGSQDGYKDAGVSLARCVIHFPSSGVGGPALVELAYIHQKINRPDLALKLLDKARLQVDQTRDPDVHARMEKLIAAISAGSNPPASDEAAR